MKKIVSFLVLTLFLVGCSSVAVPEKVSENGEAVKVEEVEKEIEYKNVEDVKDVVVSVDSFLIDNTNIGFNYESGMVMDQDFSTAWCSEKGGKVGELTMDFADYVQASKVGVLPGFGRDENIYSKNNRIKSLGITFDQGEEQIFDFDDSYRMHFVDLNEAKFKKVKFVIKDVYNGSKYNDTCVSEIDFWSDFVASEDSQAAMNYYVKYKKNFAMKPYDIVGKIVLSDLAFDKCGHLSKPKGYDNGGYMFNWKGGGDLKPGVYFYDDPVYISAAVNEYGSENDEVDLKVYYSPIFVDQELLESRGYVITTSFELVDSTKLKVAKSCDGKLYINYPFKSKMDPPLGDYRIDFLKNGKLIGSVDFANIQ